MLPTTTAFIIIVENRGQVTLMIQSIFNTRAASSRTPELFNFLWKTGRLNDTNCYSQSCSEGLSESLWVSTSVVITLRLNDHLLMIRMGWVLEKQWFPDGHSPNLASVDRVLPWNEVQCVGYLLRRGFGNRMYGGKSQWTPQGILKWSAPSEWYWGEPRQQGFWGVANGHWMPYLKGAWAGLLTEYTRKMICWPSQQLESFLNWIHLAYHLLQQIIMNHKWNTRDSGPVGLGWGHVSKGFLVILILNHISYTPHCPVVLKSSEVLPGLRVRM